MQSVSQEVEAQGSDGGVEAGIGLEDATAMGEHIEEPAPEEPSEPIIGGALAMPRAFAERCADAASIGANARITCPLAPFNGVVGHCGRLGVFPKNGPMAKKKVATRCALHSCCSFFRRRRVSDRHLLVWLSSGTIAQPGGGRGAEHGRLGSACSEPACIDLGARRPGLEPPFLM